MLETQRGHSAALQPQLLRMPALIFQGTADHLVPPAVADDLHRRLVGSPLVMIAGGSHMLPVTHSDLLADHIHAFLSGTETQH